VNCVQVPCHRQRKQAGGSRQRAANIKRLDRKREAEADENYKLQITMTKIQNPKPVLVIEYWNLRFICNLVLGVWDFYRL
jgi:hypothetical protein